ncbi:MAG: hypothetical protein MUP85_21010, partial [Candidatus Lokiarchaeota archaeon]|nr:hypothetical protein [Candidatus Lokiarchaeota archaeon]
MTIKLTQNKKRRLLILLSLLVLLNIRLFFPTDSLNSNDFTKTQEEQFNNEFLVLSNGVGEDPWWDGDWRFRVQLTTSFVEYAKMDVHVYTTVNFTDYMEKVGAASETFDVNSIRLIEYLDEDNFWETPYKINSSDPQDPEKIQLVWILNGTTPEDTSRMFYIYFDTVEYGPKAAPTYETLFSGTRAQYENNQLVIDDLTNWYSWNDPTTQLTHEMSLSSTDGTYIAGDNAIRSDSNDHFANWAYTNYAPFNQTVGNNADQIRYIDVWWYYMDSNADIMLQIQDDGNWDKRWCYDVESIYNGYNYGYPTGIQGYYTNQDANTWKFYRMDLLNQFGIQSGSSITGLAFSSDNGDVIYDHIMFEKENTTDIILGTEPEKKTAEITIITKDVDGQIILGAEVYLLNVSASEPIIKSGITDSQGQIVFDNVSYGVYDIIVNYSLSTGLKKNVYNSTKLGVNHNIDILYQTIYLKLDLWTIDFKIQDYDHKALSMGYINVKESSGGQSLVNLSLDENGWQKFVWLNRSDYYYEAYYHNDDYNPIDTLIDTGTVSRKTE